MYINESFVFFIWFIIIKKERIPAIYLKKDEKKCIEKFCLCVYYFIYRIGYTCVCLCECECDCVWILSICYYNYMKTKIECRKGNNAFKIGFILSPYKIFSNQIEDRKKCAQFCVALLLLWMELILKLNSPFFCSNASTEFSALDKLLFRFQSEFPGHEVKNESNSQMRNSNFSRALNRMHSQRLWIWKTEFF